MSTPTHIEAGETLRLERERLIHQLKELGATESGELSGDVDFGDGFADAAAATAERTETIGLAESVHAMLLNVDAAIARWEDGKYGICIKCGQEISAARLEFRPESVNCVACKSAS